MSIITLTTDFGTGDWFVGTMKGVILRLAPRACIVDLTHEIAAGDVHAGAIALMAGCSFFPKGTVHAVVVDPGVGTRRRAIAVQTENGFFVGPDNGVLSFALRREQIKSVCQLTNEELFLKPVSRTFHGRDIFAPIAARLAGGLAMQRLGPPLKDFVRLPWPAVKLEHGTVKGEVIHMDRFGNAITNIPASAIEAARATTVWVRQQQLCRMADYYQAVPVGVAVGVIGSSGLLEIAVNGGSAAARYRLRPRMRVEVRDACRAIGGKK